MLYLFFSIVQRIYTISSASTKRWEILMNHIKSLTLKSLSETRWECRLESVKAIRYQLPNIREALLEVANTCNDTKIKSEAQSLVCNEIESFELITSIILWYNILHATNTVSKYLQSKDMQLDIGVKHLNGLFTFLRNYRLTGFAEILIEAKKLASDLEVEHEFKRYRPRKKRRLFEYEGVDINSVISAEKNYEINCFIPVLNMAINSLEKRLEAYEMISKNFGFLYNFQALRDLENVKLQQFCKNLDSLLRDNESNDVNGEDLFTELKIFKTFVPNTIITKAIDVLTFILKNHLNENFPNIFIAYRILLTLPITVASGERSFSKLKLIRTYLRNSMSQQRLSGLAILSIEKEETSLLNYDDLINVFAAQKSRKINFV